MWDKSILAVSFGTSFAASRKAAIEPVEKDLGRAFPGFGVRRAFTSGMIRRSIAAREGIDIDDVAGAAEWLLDQGCQTLLCQPTHVINGVENGRMLEDLTALSGRFKKMAFGAPLLSSDRDYVAVADILAKRLAGDADTALVLMGHGTPHGANACYAALDYRFKERGYSNVFVGAVEGYPEPDVVIRLVGDAGYRKVRLAPLMVVAGDHAWNDMASDERDSWKTRFSEAGFAVETVIRGLGEYADIRALYVLHAREAAEKAGI